ncbi:hypothetical protein HMN09_01115200 [Mycena chlorophos]|uniref:Uncharacterized protein n=1 Tax=Mycena chlorophos TaxID=658473 RepID=A0A8H6SB56_MYCCL|nr:hypothetical protein HMN09_01115200 [Mycena chlorophos]
MQRTQSLPLLSLGGSSMARVSSTPATTTRTPASTDDPKIVETSYGGTPVYEMTCNGIAVVKRRSDAPGRLWRGRWGGEHEMLKRGGGTLQGTCIPLARVVASCEKYHCEAQQRPLLHFEKQDERVLENTSEERVEATKPTLSLSTEQLQAQPSDHELFLSSPSSSPPEPAYDDLLDRLLTRADGIHRVHRHRRCLTVSSRPRYAAAGEAPTAETVGRGLCWSRSSKTKTITKTSRRISPATVVVQTQIVVIELKLEQHDSEDNASPRRGGGGLRDALNNAWAQNADALEDAARKGMEERRVKSKSHRMRSAAASMESASSSASAFGDQDGTTKSGGRERNRATIITTDEEGVEWGHVPEEEEDDEGDNSVGADKEVARSLSISIPTSSPTTSHTPPPTLNDLPDGDHEQVPELERHVADVVMVPLVPSSQSAFSVAAGHLCAVSAGSLTTCSRRLRCPCISGDARPREPRPSAAGAGPDKPVQTILISAAGSRNIVPISLYISIEFIYYEKTDQPTLARSWNLSDDRGQIEYIFSDKTGTLTQNSMAFCECSIGGKRYTGSGDEPSLPSSIPSTSTDRPSSNVN